MNLGFSKLKKASASQLFRGSFAMFVGSVLTNFSNYVYTVVMGRLLGPIDYGILMVLTSLLYIFSVPALSLNTVCVKFSSQFLAENDYHKVWVLLVDLTKKMLLGGSIICYAFVVFSYPTARFLKIPSNLSVVLLGLLLASSFFEVLNRSFLQGMKRFTFISFNNILGALLKLSLGIFLVQLGFSVNGALFAIVLSFLIPYFVAFLPLKKLRLPNKKKVKLEGRAISKFAFSTMLAVLGLTLLVNQDVVFVKRYFPEYEAGLYAALSLIGKIVFFASTSVVAVMFPIISERYTARVGYKNVLLGTLGLVFLVCSALAVIYISFPEVVVRLVFGEKYLEITPFVGRIGLFLSLYSLCYVFVTFFLAIHKTSVAIFPLIFALLQAILLAVYHGTFKEVISVSLLSTALSLFFLVGYYVRMEIRT